MQKSDTIRLRHMFDAAKEAMSFIQEEKRASLDADRKLVLALMKSVEIIGEAATKVTKECQEDLSQIPCLVLSACEIA
jgi:uncharacterized protein with HEPN domain